MMSAMLVTDWILIIQSQSYHDFDHAQREGQTSDKTRQAWRSNCREGGVSAHFQSKYTFLFMLAKKNAVSSNFNCYK